MTAINGTPRPVNPPDNTAHTTVRRTGRTRPSRQPALAVALTAALLAGVSIAIDAAASTATTPEFDIAGDMPAAISRDGRYLATTDSGGTLVGAPTARWSARSGAR